jgi:hypothetical protein
LHIIAAGVALGVCVALEFLIIVFRIAEDVGDIAQIERTSQRNRTLNSHHFASESEPG